MGLCAIYNLIHTIRYVNCPEKTYWNYLEILFIWGSLIKELILVIICLLIFQKIFFNHYIIDVII
jgi:hypothetical protein